MFELSKKYINAKKEDLKYEDIEILRKLIEYHSDLYYNKETPIISDYDYDNLFKKLEFLEKKFNITNRQSSLVGAEITESTFKKIKHSRPMISLDNTYNENELNDFDERVKKILKIDEKEKLNYAIEYKFDGLGIELIYYNGVLKQAITRGNGIEGEDVTENVKQVKNIPHNINYKEHIEVRGEILMPKSVLKKLNNEAEAKGTKIFSNTRNAASGSIRTKDINTTKNRGLKFYAYDLANFEEYKKNTGKVNYDDIVKSLGLLGFEISDFLEKYNGIKGIIKSIENFGNKRKKIDFDVDGLVVYVNNTDLWEQIGWTEHHPRYAIAYKFPAEILTTKVIGVEHNVGRTGTITPTAILEPINISGAIIKRATLHNYDEVKNLDVRIGDTVFIKRAGEVIPKIISVVDVGDRGDYKKILAPKFCPSCKTKTKKDEDKVRYYCPNTIDCPAQHIEKLIFAVGKTGFNINGLGEKQIELFMKEGIINNIIDIFNLKNKKDEILTLDGYKEKSVSNLINAIEQAKNQDIVSLLTALGIPGVGKKTAKTISQLFLSKENLLNFSYSLEELENLQDIGPEIAKNILEYFNDEAHIKILKELTKILNISYYKNKKIASNSIFFDKNVCITGSFEYEGEKISRDELVDRLENVGGKFVGSVSKNTDYLLAGEKAGSKLKKAEELGIKIITLKYFLNNL